MALSASSAIKRCPATQAAFGQQRKMLRQSLKGFAAARGLDLPALIARLLEPTTWAEEVDVGGLVALTRGSVGPRGRNNTVKSCYARELE
jgi:hypothetical protein